MSEFNQEHPDSELTQAEIYRSLESAGASPAAETEAPVVRVIDLSELVPTELSAGDVITGISDLKALNRLEVLLAEKTGPYEHNLYSPLLRNPLADELRPPKFHGDIRDITVIVAPLSDSARGRMAGQRNTETIEQASTYIVGANLYSTGRGLQGTVAREVTYWQRSTYLESNDRRDKGQVIRWLGPRTGLLKSDQVAAALETESAAVYSDAVRYALRHVYGGGAPGLGKRS